MSRLLFTLLILLMPIIAAAQEDAPLIQPISIGVTVQDSISDEATFDWWQLELTEGDQIRVLMSASGGLAPIVGIIDEGGNLLARSDDGAVNSTLRLDYTVTQTKQYSIAVTRVGTEQGTTTGAYTLRVDIVESAAPNDTYGAVTFRCNDFEAVSLTVVRFEPESLNAFYAIHIYGVDGLDPYVYIQTSREGDVEPCINIKGAQTYNVTLPDGITYTTDNIINAGINLDAASDFGTITITFAAAPGTSGRFLAVIDGFSIDPADNVDMFAVRNAPRPALNNPLDVYMVSTDTTSRLDPTIINAETDQRCDDAGRRGCEDTPAIIGVGVEYPNSTRIIGSRLDAGIRLPVGFLEMVNLEFSSRNHRTTGGYALMLIGGLAE